MQQLEKKHQLAILVIVGIILFGAGFKYAMVKGENVARASSGQVLEKQSGEIAGKTKEVAGKTSENTGKTNENGGKTKEVVVHVTGAVSNPGLYHLPPGARMNDAVEQAKPLEEADLNAINLAELLVDGKPVKIPFKATGQPVNVATSEPTAAQGKHADSSTSVSRSNPVAQLTGGKVNINTAGAAELDKLPGIGPTMAERIVQYRQDKGLFATVDDLKNVSGIGEKKFTDLKDLITIN